MPLRKFTALSARTVACFLASEDDPEKGLCPHEPAMPSGLQASTGSGKHRKHEVRSCTRIGARPEKGSSQSGSIISTVRVERATKDRGASAKETDPGERFVSNRPSSDGAPSCDSKNGDRSAEASVEKGRGKDPKSFTQNLFDTVAVRMLEWLPVPSLMSMPDLALGGEKHRDSSKTPKRDENQTNMRKLDQPDKVESRKLRNPNAGDSKLKPRSHSVTTRLRLNSASIHSYTNPPATRKVSKPRVLGASEELKQESNQYSQPDTLGQRQGLREQGAHATTQSERSRQAEQKSDGSAFEAVIPNGDCTTASGSPDSEGHLKAWISQNQDDSLVSCTHELVPWERSRKFSEADAPQRETLDSLPGSPSLVNSDPDSTLLFDLPVEQTLTEIHPCNGHAHYGSTQPIASSKRVLPIDTLGGSHSSGSSIVGLPPDTPLTYGTDPKTPSTLLLGTGQSLSGRTAVPVKKSTGQNTSRLPQSLSHLSLDIVDGLLDMVKPTSKIAEDPLLFYKLSGFRVGQASKTSILRQHRRALQFGAQSLFYVMSTPGALLQSFRTQSDDTLEPTGKKHILKSDHPSQIDQAIRQLKVFDESRVIFRSLWIALGALFTPPPDLSHPKSPRLKAAISLSKSRSSSSSGEHAADPSSATKVYFPDCEAVHILKLSLSALVAAVPQASAQTMLAVRTLRASGRVAPDANLLATNSELIKSLLKVTDALEDDLALALMCRLVQAIAARCCAAEIIKNKQTRNYSRTGQEGGTLDVLGLLRDYLREAHSESSYSSAAESPLAGGDRGKPITAESDKDWSMSAVTVEWLRSVLLKEWDGRAEVARWGVVGGAVMILASLCKLHL